VITFKFRETLELNMGNPEPNPFSENKKKGVGAETQWKLF